MTHDKCPTCGAERLEIENRFVSTLWCPYCGTIQSVGCTAYVPRDRAAMAAEIATLTASRDKWRGLAEKLVDTVQSLADWLRWAADAVLVKPTAGEKA